MLWDIVLIPLRDEDVLGDIALPACSAPIAVEPSDIVVVVAGDIVLGCIWSGCIDEVWAIATGANAPIVMARPKAATNANERIKLSPVKQARPTRSTHQREWKLQIDWAAGDFLGEKNALL